MKKLTYRIVLLLALSSCSSTELVTLSVTEPAPVTIPSDIKRIMVVNRTGVSDKNRQVDIVDKVFSLEGRELDIEGANASAGGMIDELTRNNRFEEVLIYPDVLTHNSVAGVFPAPLS